MNDGPKPRVPPPSPFLLLFEGQRALLEMVSLLPAGPLLRQAPRGDGHPVMVLPGFTAGDETTIALRLYLRSLGYRAHRWRLGRNLGFRGDRKHLEEKLGRRVEELSGRYGQRISLVGWSLGGIYAREVARAVPGLVRQVITLGSPFAGAGHGSNVRHIYEMVTRRKLREHDREQLARLHEPPPVPSTAIFSRSDGIAHWQACRESEAPHTDNIEVFGSHCGLGFHPAVLYAVADRLALPEDGWARFDRGGWRRLLYR